ARVYANDSNGASHGSTYAWAGTLPAGGVDALTAGGSAGRESRVQKHDLIGHGIERELVIEVQGVAINFTAHAADPLFQPERATNQITELDRQFLPPGRTFLRLGCVETDLGLFRRHLLTTHLAGIGRPLQQQPRC